MTESPTDNPTAEFLFRAPNESSLSPSLSAPLEKAEIVSSGAPLNKAESSFRAPIKHNHLRRKNNYNYCSRAMYLITVTTTDRQRLLGSLVGDSPDKAAVIPTALGEDVIAFFKHIEQITFKKSGCRVQVIQYQLMPDHFHGILFVKDELPPALPLGKIIRDWKGACSRAYWSASSLSHSPSSGAPLNKAERIPLFSPGFNDKILFHEGQLENWIDYVHDNPRRLAIKRANPDLFRIHQQTDVCGITCTTLGNIFLSKYPLRAALQCSRSLTPADISALRDECLAQAANGTVFVTAAISEGEKIIARTLREAGYPLIILLENGFPKPDDPHYKYFKPQGVYFEACAAEKLLLVEPAQALLDRSDIAAQVTAKAGDIPHTSKRYRFLALNALAFLIAS